MTTDKNILIVDFSVTGHCDKIASLLFEALCKHTKKVSVHRRKISSSLMPTGFFSMLKAGIATFLNRRPSSISVSNGHRFYDSDYIVLVAPVWIGQLALPVQFFIKEHLEKCPMPVGLIVSSGGKPNLSIIDQAEKLLHEAVQLRLFCPEKEQNTSLATDKIDQFARKILQSLKV